MNNRLKVITAKYYTLGKDVIKCAGDFGIINDLYDKNKLDKALDKLEDYFNQEYNKAVSSIYDSINKLQKEYDEYRIEEFIDSYLDKSPDEVNKELGSLSLRFTQYFNLDISKALKKFKLTLTDFTKLISSTNKGDNIIKSNLILELNRIIFIHLNGEPILYVDNVSEFLSLVQKYNECGSTVSIKCGNIGRNQINDEISAIEYLNFILSNGDIHNFSSVTMLINFLKRGNMNSNIILGSQIRRVK